MTDNRYYVNLCVDYPDGLSRMLRRYERPTEQNAQPWGLRLRTMHSAPLLPYTCSWHPFYRAGMTQPEAGTRGARSALVIAFIPRCLVLSVLV